MSDLDQVLEGIGETKALLREVIRRQDITNGRVKGLEEREAIREVVAAEARGLAAGRSEALVSRKQVLQLGALATAVASIAGLLAPVIARVME